MNPPFFLRAACLLALSFSAADAVELIRDGKPQSQIVVAKDALPQVRFAAKELQEHLKKISGAELPILDKADGHTPHVIYVGESEGTKAFDLKLEALPMEGYRVFADEKALVLAGRDGTALPVPRGIKDIEDRPRLTDQWQERTGEKWDMPRNGLYDPRFFNAEAGFSLYDPSGTLYAVYDLLESLGVRWYLPYHEFGTVLPEMKTVGVPAQDRAVKPAFGYRFMRWSFPSGDLPGFLWAKRQKVGMDELIWLDHGTSNITRLMDDAHPEYFALVGGLLRSGTPTPLRGHRQLRRAGVLPRLAPPLADALVRYADFFFADYPEMPLFPVGPSDAFTSIDDRDVAAGWLREERGAAGRMSDYVWGFVNDVAAQIGRKHPGKLVLGLAYTYYRLPPADLETLHDNVAIAYCQQRYNQAIQPDGEAALFAEREAWWRKLPSGVFYVWEYNLQQFGLGDRKWSGQLLGFPVFAPGLLQRDIKALAGRSRGEYVECAHNREGKMLSPGLNHLRYYLQARLYWSPDLDADALIEEYCRLFFGPAAAEMREFYRFAEEVWIRPASRQITLTGGFLRPPDVERFFALLDAASSKAGRSVYGERIALLRKEAAPMKEIFPALQRQGPEFAAARATGTGPKVDGDLGKPFWKDAPVYPMRDLFSGEPVSPAGEVRFRWAADDSGLYVGITAHEPQMAQLALPPATALRDSMSIYDTEFIELFLETPEHSTFQLVVNPDGAIYDACTDSRIAPKAIAWSAGWHVATRKDADRWCVEFFIPKESLGNAGIPTAEAQWGVNVCRTRHLSGKAQNSAISPTGGRFFLTEKFGSLTVSPGQ